jgi:hypothetical protein
MNRRVLAVGKRRRVLGKLNAALTEAGFDARWTDDIAGASQRFQPSGVDLVAFGRGVSGADRTRLKAGFLAGNPAVRFVDGLAPIIPLLVAQVEGAFSARLGNAGVLDQAASGDGELTIDVRDDCDLEVTLYRLDRLYRSHRNVLLSERVPRGRRSIPLGTRGARRGATFAVVRVNATEATVIEL